MFNSENVISLDGKGITAGHLFDKTELIVFMIWGHQRVTCQKDFMKGQNICIEF